MRISDLLEGKGTKEQAGYIPRPKNGEKCINCTMWRDPNKCSAVAGDISPNGWCEWYAGGAYGKRGKRVNEDSQRTPIIDNKNGWGAVPNNQEVDYLGLRVSMSPKHFIDLAAPLGGEPSDKIAQHIEQGGTIGSPFLIIEIPEAWGDGDFAMPARVVGHEGRNRMLAVAKVLGNSPIETHLFFSQGLRNRHITDEFKKNLNRGLVKEKSKSIVRGPFFNLQESILEWGRIVKGVNTTVDVGPNEIKTQAAKFGNTVDKDGRPPTMSSNVKGKSTNVLYNLGLAESKELPRYTAAEWAIIEGGHTLEEPAVEFKKPGRLFASLTEERTNNESFDTQVNWVKDMDSGGIQVFATKVEDAYIELTYKRMANDDVYIAFSRGGRSSVTGEGNQNKIFGAVINHIQKWVNANKPPRIVFSAFKPNTGAFGAQDTTRSSLYRRMVQRFASQNGYEYDVEDTGNEDTFILTKTNIEENFADGKVSGKSRPGRVKRAGASCNGSVTALRKRAKNSSGEKAKMLHWCANMKSGRKKK